MQRKVMLIAAFVLFVFGLQQACTWWQSRSAPQPAGDPPEMHREVGRPEGEIPAGTGPDAASWSDTDSAKPKETAKPPVVTEERPPVPRTPDGAAAKAPATTAKGTGKDATKRGPQVRIHLARRHAANPKRAFTEVRIDPGMVAIALPAGPGDGNKHSARAAAMRRADTAIRAAIKQSDLTPAEISSEIRTGGADPEAVPSADVAAMMALLTRTGIRIVTLEGAGEAPVGK